MLPLPLYYLSDQIDTQQIWRLERDGQTLTQITDLPYPVDNFEISPTTGEIAYLTNSILRISDAFGRDDQVVIDNNQLKCSSKYMDEYSDVVNDFVWSPDGARLALGGCNGVWIYNLKSQSLTHLISNPPKIAITEPRFAQAWSPDGTILLLEAAFEASDVWYTGFIAIERPGLVIANGLRRCADITWSRDGQFAYVSQAFINPFCDSAGLSRWNLEKNESTFLIPVVEPSREFDSVEFVQMAQEGPDGYLYYFYSRGEPNGFLSPELGMYRSEKDGITGRTLLRSNYYQVIEEILWSPDMTFAIIVEGDTTPDDLDQVMLLTTDNKPVLILVPNGKHLRWGK